jgi:hypothetical protein
MCKSQMTATLAQHQQQEQLMTGFFHMIDD